MMKGRSGRRSLLALLAMLLSCDHALRSDMLDIHGTCEVVGYRRESKITLRGGSAVAGDDERVPGMEEEEEEEFIQGITFWSFPGENFIHNSSALFATQREGDITPEMKLLYRLIYSRQGKGFYHGRSNRDGLFAATNGSIVRMEGAEHWLVKMDMCWTRFINAVWHLAVKKFDELELAHVQNKYDVSTLFMLFCSHSSQTDVRPFRECFKKALLPSRRAGRSIAVDSNFEVVLAHFHCSLCHLRDAWKENLKNQTRKEELISRVQGLPWSDRMARIIRHSETFPLNRSVIEDALLLLNNSTSRAGDGEQGPRKRLKGPFERAADKIFEAEDATFKEMRKRWDKIVNPDGQGYYHAQGATYRPAKEPSSLLEEWIGCPGSLNPHTASDKASERCGGVTAPVLSGQLSGQAGPRHPCPARI
eukprot:768811-Hanusia_phi.AAC.1